MLVAAMIRRLIAVTLLLALAASGVWLASSRSLAPTSRDHRTDRVDADDPASPLTAPAVSAAVEPNGGVAEDASREPLAPQQHRRIRVQITRVPQHIVDRYELTAHAGAFVTRHRVQQTNARRHQGSPTTDVHFDLSVIPDFRGVLHVHAKHRITGWRTTIASEMIGPERETVEIDALHCSALRSMHSLQARVHLPAVPSWLATLRLVPVWRLDNAKGTCVPLAARGIEATAWVHGLSAGEYVPFLEELRSGDSEYRCELPPIRVEGDTEAELRAPRSGKLTVTLESTGGDVETPWLEIRSRNGARIPHVQERRPHGVVEVTGLGSNEVLVQAVGQQTVSRGELVRLDEAWPRSLELPLRAAGRLGIRLEARGRVTDLRIVEAATRVEVPLTTNQVDDFRRMRGLELRLPPGGYAVSATVADRVVEKNVRVGHDAVVFLR